MQVKELVKYINNPNLLSKESIPVLQKLANDFPYFQSAHILLSIASKKWDTSVYQQSIKKTAIVVTNRTHLYNLIHQPETVTEPLEATIQKEVKELTAPKVNTDTEVKTDVVKKVDDKKIIIADEREVEQEIEKALVASILETEITKVSDKLNKEKEPKPDSFSDWLQFLKKNNGETYTEIEEKVKIQKNKNLEKSQEEQVSKIKQKQKALIDKIIDINPGPIRQKEDQKFFKSDFKAKESLLENEHLVTETLAQIFASQGNLNKAIRAYEILSLKFPQKSVYFASLIQNLKNKQ
jgi:hypothetical protein